nr:uncharacterized protein LOC124217852 [Neodiprion pinetum]
MVLDTILTVKRLGEVGKKTACFIKEDWCAVGPLPRFHGARRPLPCPFLTTASRGPRPLRSRLLCPRRHCWSRSATRSSDHRNPERNAGARSFSHPAVIYNAEGSRHVLIRINIPVICPAPHNASIQDKKGFLMRRRGIRPLGSPPQQRSLEIRAAQGPDVMD